jgi:hypothetical protein
MLGRMILTSYRQPRIDGRSRLVPLTCGLLSLLGAILWSPAAVVLGLAAVAFWTVFASVVARGLTMSEATRLARSD